VIRHWSASLPFQVLVPALLPLFDRPHCSLSILCFQLLLRPWPTDIAPFIVDITIAFTICSVSSTAIRVAALSAAVLLQQSPDKAPIFEPISL
jgi:hypothetical protein